LATISSLVAEDLEFYHDKNNICGKGTRELVPGTLQVDPIANYGAVEIGVHRFHHPGDDSNVGEAQFVTLWQHKMAAGRLPAPSALTITLRGNRADRAFPLVARAH
jgi:hypothetical protein